MVTEIPGIEDVDAVIICAINDPQTAYDDACAKFPPERVLVYEFLGIATASKPEQGEM